MPYSLGDVLTTGTRNGIAGQTVVILIEPDGAICTGFIPLGARTITEVSTPVTVTLPPIGFFDLTMEDSACGKGVG